MSHRYLQTEREDRVLTVWLTNPPHNFLTTGMIKELKQVIDQVKRDDSLGALVITSGVEGVLLTHFDVAEIKQSAESVPMSLSLSQAASRLADAQAWAARLATRPASAVAAIKEAVYQGASRRPLEHQLFIDFSVVANVAHFGLILAMGIVMGHEHTHLYGDVLLGWISLIILIAFWWPARRFAVSTGEATHV